MSVEKPGRSASEGRVWETPRLVHVGDVAHIVQSGNGKSSITPTDPGEPNKTKPAAGSD